MSFIEFNPEDIIVNEKNNIRNAKEYGDIESLAKSIKANGVQKALTVFINKDGQYELNDGFRRMRAIALLKKQKVIIKKVKCLVIDLPTEESRIFDMFISADSKPLTPLEQGEAIKRLQAYGYSLEEIAEKIGKTIRYIKELLNLNDMPKQIKNKIKEGVISASSVIRSKPEEHLELAKTIEKAEKLNILKGKEAKVKPSDLKQIKKNKSAGEINSNAIKVLTDLKTDLNEVNIKTPLLDLLLSLLKGEEAYQFIFEELKEMNNGK